MPAVCRDIPNIHFHPYVTPSQVIALAREADIGFCMLDADCLSYTLSLPNKFFEYAMAGVPIVANDLPEMAALIRPLRTPAGNSRRRRPRFHRRIPGNELQRKAMNARRSGMRCRGSRKLRKLRPVYERWFGLEHRHQRLPAP